jgi:hypothetical protein
MSGYMNKKSEPFRLEDQIPLGALNNLREGMPRQIRGGRGTDVSQMGDRLTVRNHGESVVTPDIGIYTAPFVVLQELDDYLLCTPFTQPTQADGWWIPQGYDSTLGTGATVFIYVAKPYLLQKSGWNGKTVTVGSDDLDIAFDGVTVGQRTVTDVDGVIQTQKIATPYVAGDVIWACMGVTGLTAPSGEPIVWMDRNDAARQWLTTEVDTGGSDPTSIIGGNYAGPISVNAMLSVMQQSSSTRDKYQQWWRTHTDAISAPWMSFYLGGEGRVAHPTTSAVIEAPFIIYLPIIITQPAIVKNIMAGVGVTSPGNHFRLGIYDNLAIDGWNHSPNNRLAQVEFETTAIGARHAAVDLTVEGNQLYWLAYSGEVNLTMANREWGDLWAINGITHSASTINNWCPIVGYLTERAAYGTLPADASTELPFLDQLTMFRTDNLPLIGISFIPIP